MKKNVRALNGEAAEHRGDKIRGNKRQLTGQELNAETPSRRVLRPAKTADTERLDLRSEDQRRSRRRIRVVRETGTRIPSSRANAQSKAGRRRTQAARKARR